MLASAAMAAGAAPKRPIATEAGPLGAAVRAIGSQAGVTIGIADPGLAALRVRAVRGRLDAATALARLVRGTGAAIVRGADDSFRIVPRAAPPSRRAPPASAASATTTPAADTIVVTGSKRGEVLATYAGSVGLVAVSDLRPNRLAHGSEALIEVQPVLSATHLGPGRNKLFVRGIADSSFNGPTESTVGQYLGEVRLNYNAPDPDLALYDIQSVEILEGPQGTLYGAGSLGGIIRLVPTPPDLDKAALSISGGVSATAHGAPGGDGAVIGNLPFAGGAAALRAVVYGDRDGGYVDDPLRRRADINSTTIAGGRGTLRVAPGDGWTIDLGGVVQQIDSRDGQYSERGLPPLQRESRIAQPFDNDYALASLVARRRWGATELVSASSAVFHDLESVFDASGTGAAAAPMRYIEDNRIRILTNETRLSRRADDGGGWVLGLELLHSASRLTRNLGPPGEEARIVGTHNHIDEVSLYGEATRPVARALFATLGGRLAYTAIANEGRDTLDPGDLHRHGLSLLPSAGLLWRVAPRLAFYVRYQQGYRPGGLSAQRATTERFRPDRVTSAELGARLGGAGDRLRASAAVSYTRWTNIQADLVGTDGLPLTANIGSGRIVALEAQLAWRLVAGLSVEGAMFINDSNLSRPTAAFAGERDATLPNIADAVARLGLRARPRLFGRTVELTGFAHYVGRSRLGVGPVFAVPQDRYVNLTAGLSVPLGRVTLSLDGDNLTDHRGNIFALGNPFGASAGRQITTLRPRTIRLGAGLAF
ncbi:TonB-dependent receptor [Sphingomonas morindae]|uniref:TonB-dependent receptor n=1 Tax=Sphingomonas morindae TaxID=1541170 RepID=A0ABY4XBY2_9SPHN|nr:TonB-dependent receptor [Sphingomonas morindae]USI74472.1 TonB-dependent receptor [Sphingomonas morindae]